MAGSGEVAVGGEADLDLLVGAWRLVSAEYRYQDQAGGSDGCAGGAGGDGEVVAYLGDAPQGMLVYARGGEMSVQLMACGRPAFQNGDRLGGSDAEVRAAFEGYHSYFGRYSVDASARCVVHHIEGCAYPNFVGTDQQRWFSLEVPPGDTSSSGGGGSGGPEKAQGSGDGGGESGGRVGAREPRELTLTLTTSPLLMRGRLAVGALMWRRTV
ncbi:hypothetical protein FOA52_003520 [Chlamydomonas sp. UWO 241]|nr:hypothetical protein FOA52_003520 [Chlamydomonas sp. UWO 241]